MGPHRNVGSFFVNQNYYSSDLFVYERFVFSAITVYGQGMFAVLYTYSYIKGCFRTRYGNLCCKIGG